MGLNRFAHLHQSDKILHEICARLGSDINFFLGGPVAYCTGRGEKIEKIDKLFEFSALVCTPPVSVATKSVYANYVHDQALYRCLSEQILPLLTKKNLDSVAKMCANMLESSCYKLYPQLEHLKEVCQQESGLQMCLSGSGSAVYVLIDRASDKLVRLQEVLKKEFSCESRFINNNRW
jgi:4-diphosphocytidyl-2-C-methyl-D-erythritol kinase